jgi:dihydromonapterin reductase/dihydrofolate reductase
VSHAATLITGVGRRAGLHIARTLLRRGLPVIGTYRSRRPGLQELEQLGAELLPCDFDSQAQVQQLIDSVSNRHAQLRALVHNASDWLSDSDERPVEQIMDKMMRVHVNVPYQLNLAFSPLLQACEERHADIIHIGDYVSSRGSRKHIAYAASKAAQDNLTLSFAVKLAPKVKVNSLAPALLKFNEQDDADYRRKAVSKSLMQREAGWDELMQAIDYLMASGYVTGRILPLDGGRHLK